jgi:FtsP/CotA-like multicopper oxidase with cupredoxin domain
MSSRKGLVLSAVAGISAMILAGAQVPVRAQSPQPPAQIAQQTVPCPAQLQPLIPVPEIRSDTSTHRFKATVEVRDAKRTMWGNANDDRCFSQSLRYLMGAADTAHLTSWPSGPEPIPGPTLRARVGDLVEIMFFNEINTAHFSFSGDRAGVGDNSACDQYTTNGGKNQYGVAGDAFPDCLHGSSTTNLHFHGTHTSPSTTGDNVLLFIRPASRMNGKLQPSESQYVTALGPFFSKCEKQYATAAVPAWPALWTDMPPSWATLQRNLVQQFDKNAVLPDASRLWPVNQSEIAAKLWPQYNIGAVPFCFPLPKFATPMHMGQSPGTHWYHAHKHGSTALNVANGMTGALIIEGQYDDDLRSYYKKVGGLKERVLVIQQLSAAPFPVTNPAYQPQGPGAPRPRISVNGRINPVVAMKLGEVQMWRIVNGAFRDAIQFASFQYTKLPSSPSATVPDSCFGTSPLPKTTPQPRWRQLAQDGVQFAAANYDAVGSVGNPFNLAPANRADVLVQAPAKPGSYTLCIVRNNGLTLQTTPAALAAAPGAMPRSASALLTVNVGGIGPAMDFIPRARFPQQPEFLADIPPIPPDKPNAPIKAHKTVTFGAAHNLIDGKTFQDTVINQTMALNTAEEWIVQNQAQDKSHPFHIHINPFQIIELFQPNLPDAQQPCAIDPNDPKTFDPNAQGFKPCANRQLPAPWVWWDTFAIPTGRQVDITTKCSTTPTVGSCPAPLRPYTQCSGSPVACIETIPGWFRMRSKFVDYTGMYVLHCHILVHEDRGMMQLIEVVPGGATPSKRTKYTHH